jgi:hypothetical protein
MLLRLVLLLLFFLEIAAGNPVCLSSKFKSLSKNSLGEIQVTVY